VTADPVPKTIQSLIEPGNNERERERERDRGRKKNARGRSRKKYLAE
jgi:hypothetical protein